MTPEQQRTLSLIRDYIAENGISPTRRELMSLEGCKSTSAVHRRVWALVDMGHLIAEGDGHRRNFRLADSVNLIAVPTPALQAELKRRGELS